MVVFYIQTKAGNIRWQLIVKFLQSTTSYKVCEGKETVWIIAAMESFFGRLKRNAFYGREFNTREEIVNAVRDYLDYYNHRRIQLKLKGLSPIQYRRQSSCE